MKKLSFLLIGTFALGAFFLFGNLNQGKAQIASSEIVSLFTSCDINNIPAKFSSDVELSFFDNAEVIGKAQVTAAFLKFFRENPCKSFVVKHQAQEKNDGSKFFFIGTLTTASRTFRVVVYTNKDRILDLDIKNPRD